jgi:inosine-uridine nucleoside N-ribohydrolase
VKFGKWKKNTIAGLALLAHACTPSYSGAEIPQDPSLKPAQENTHTHTHTHTHTQEQQQQKRKQPTKKVTQMVEHLPSIHRL